MHTQTRARARAHTHTHTQAHTHTHTHTHTHLTTTGFTPSGSFRLERMVAMPATLGAAMSESVQPPSIQPNQGAQAPCTHTQPFTSGSPQAGTSRSSPKRKQNNNTHTQDCGPCGGRGAASFCTRGSLTVVVFAFYTRSSNCRKGKTVEETGCISLPCPDDL